MLGYLCFSYRMSDWSDPCCYRVTTTDGKSAETIRDPETETFVSAAAALEREPVIDTTWST